MFNLSIDNRFFFVSKEINSFAELFKLIAKTLVEFKPNGTYSEAKHRNDLAVALKKYKELSPKLYIKEYSDNIVQIPFDEKSHMVFYSTRGSELIVSTDQLFVALNILNKTISVYRKDSRTIVINTVNDVNSVIKVLELTAPELLNIQSKESKEISVEPSTSKKTVTKEKSATKKKASTKKLPSETVDQLAVENITKSKEEIPIISINRTLKADDDLPNVEDVFKNSDVFLQIGNTEIDNVE